MRRPRTGVMISRGDLAGECGDERLAELLEEIIGLSEAAQLPVIWATPGARSAGPHRPAVKGGDHRRRDGVCVPSV